MRRSCSARASGSASGAHRGSHQSLRQPAAAPHTGNRDCSGTKTSLHSRSGTLWLRYFRRQGSALRDELLELRAVTNGLEVQVLSSQVATALPHINRSEQVLERVFRPTSKALAAGCVVEEVRLVGALFDELAAFVRCLRVFAGVVKR